MRSVLIGLLVLACWLSLDIRTIAQENTAELRGRVVDSQEAGIPVFDGIGCPHHPSAALAARLDPSFAPEQRRRLVIQALLVDATA